MIHQTQQAIQESNKLLSVNDLKRVRRYKIDLHPFPSILDK